MKAIVPFLFVLLLFGLQTRGFSASSVSNGKIVFASNRDGRAEVYVMDSDGTNQTRLTNTGGSNYGASFSPDGQKIVFVSGRDGNFQIYVMNADGSNQTRITNDSSNNIDPAWSPDGTRIAFASDRERRYQIFAMNADGTNQVKLTNDSHSDSSPSWAPDGSKIAFDDTSTSIFVMNSDGTNVTAISNSGDTQPSWSPDGKRIAFVSVRSGSAQIYSMNPDGTGQTNVVSDIGSNFTPAWSPDNRKIAFCSNVSGYYRVYVMNAAGSNAAPLTNSTAGDGAPRWQAIPGTPCPHNLTFWKTNPTSWPVTSLELGKQKYTETQMIALLDKSSKHDASLRLTRALVSTKLNLAAGSDPDPIQSKVTAADELLKQFDGFLPYKVKIKSDVGSQMLKLATALRKYNNGGETPVCNP